MRVWRARAREVLGVVGVDGEEGGEGSGCGEESGSAGGGNGNGKVGLGPLVGTVRWFKTREWVPFSGGMGSVQMDVDDEQDHVTCGYRCRGRGRCVPGRRPAGCEVQDAAYDWYVFIRLVFTESVYLTDGFVFLFYFNFRNKRLLWCT